MDNRYGSIVSGQPQLRHRLSMWLYWGYWYHCIPYVWKIIQQRHRRATTGSAKSAPIIRRSLCTPRREQPEVPHRSRHCTRNTTKLKQGRRRSPGPPHVRQFAWAVIEWLLIKSQNRVAKPVRCGDQPREAKNPNIARRSHRRRGQRASYYLLPGLHLPHPVDAPQQTAIDHTHLPGRTGAPTVLQNHWRALWRLDNRMSD